MKGAAIKQVGKAAGERITGGRPGPARAMVAAAITGTVSAVLTYRLLRSGGD